MKVLRTLLLYMAATDNYCIINKRKTPFKLSLDNVNPGCAIYYICLFCVQTFQTFICVDAGLKS